MIEVVAGPGLEEVSGDLLVVPVFADRIWGPGAESIATALGDWVGGYFDGLDFTGKAGQVAAVPGNGDFGRVMFVGLGSEVEPEDLRRAAGDAGRAAMRYERVATTLHQVELDGAVDAVVSGFLLGQYRFDKYLSAPQPSQTARLILVGSGDVAGEIKRGRVVAGAVGLARDLVNEPAASKSPIMLADRAAAIAAAPGITIDVYDEEQIVAEGFGGLKAVSQGAVNPPRMVVMKYRPGGATAHVCFVGKGIVFDSGGLSIKPAKGMETMKTDMAGAAAVFAALGAIAELGLEVNVTGIAPLAENMTGGAAQRPGDVFRARNGKTVEVLNTDAEGRLVLADGLSLAAEEKPDLIVDVATLTGACQVALGLEVAGLFSNDDDAAARVDGAARRAGEKVWRLPLEQSYRKEIDSPIADIKNIGKRFGGAITAALFLAEFVDERPWVHLDIAGPARSTNVSGYVGKGATGFAVRTLVALAEDLAAGGVAAGRFPTDIP